MAVESASCKTLDADSTIFHQFIRVSQHGLILVGDFLDILDTLPEFFDVFVALHAELWQLRVLELQQAFAIYEIFLKRFTILGHSRVRGYELANLLRSYRRSQTESARAHATNKEEQRTPPGAQRSQLSRSTRHGCANPGKPVCRSGTQPQRN